ncbi:hypothetical protein IFR05_000214 [Cadophora sp. M221]|nr:hypothetical protein IFR05_000214 [Cadophora sp. M221]
MRLAYTHSLLQDVEPRRVAKLPEPPVALTVKSLEPNGRRIKIRRFKKFNKLPLEVKRMIWAEAAHIQRVVQFGVKNPSSNQFHHEAISINGNSIRKQCTEVYLARVSAGGNVPAMLQVNKEARSEGLRYYEKPFGEILTNAGPYFNFAADTMYFPDLQTGAVFLGSRSSSSNVANACDCSSVSERFRETITAKLRHLSFGTICSYPWNSDTRYNPSLDLFTNLQTVTIGHLGFVQLPAAQIDPVKEYLIKWMKYKKLCKDWEAIKNKPDIRVRDSREMNDLLHQLMSAKKWQEERAVRMLTNPLAEYILPVPTERSVMHSIFTPRFLAILNFG